MSWSFGQLDAVLVFSPSVMIHFGGHWSKSWKSWKWGQDGMFMCMFVCVFTCAPTSFCSYEQMFLCWRLMCKGKIRKACYFSTHLWACEKWEAHLILLAKVFLIRARFFPFCSCWGEASIFGIETSTSLTRTCNQRTFNQTPIHISVVLLICLSTCSSVNSVDSELPTWHSQ